MVRNYYHVNTCLSSARPVTNTVRHKRLKRDDFETLKVIGRGAFGEVTVLFSSHIIILQIIINIRVRFR